MHPPHDHHPLYAAIHAKLAEVVENGDSRPAWYGLWMQLGAASSADERLKVFQAVRDAGFLPEAAGFYLVAWQIDAIASERATAALQELEDRLDALEEQGDPAEYHRLLDQYHEAWDNLFVQTLREYGEHAIAAFPERPRPVPGTA